MRSSSRRFGSATARCRRSTASRSRCAKARSSACSARTAPASRRPCACSSTLTTPDDGAALGRRARRRARAERRAARDRLRPAGLRGRPLRHGPREPDAPGPGPGHERPRPARRASTSCSSSSGSRMPPTGSSRPTRAACGGGSTSRSGSCTVRASSSSTSRRRASTPRRASRCGPRCRGSPQAESLTILLTTHYLEEADQLADRLAIVSQGKVVVEGTPAELKRGLRGDAVHVELEDGAVEDAERVLASVGAPPEQVLEGRTLVARVENGAARCPGSSPRSTAPASPSRRCPSRGRRSTTSTSTSPAATSARRIADETSLRHTWFMIVRRRAT